MSDPTLVGLDSPAPVRPGGPHPHDRRDHPADRLGPRNPEQDAVSDRGGGGRPVRHHPQRAVRRHTASRFLRPTGCFLVTYGADRPRTYGHRTDDLRDGSLVVARRRPVRTLRPQRLPPVRRLARRRRATSVPNAAPAARPTALPRHRSSPGRTNSHQLSGEPAPHAAVRTPGASTVRCASTHRDATAPRHGKGPVMTTITVRMTDPLRNVCSAVSYSPTPYRVQYHRR